TLQQKILTYFVVLCLTGSPRPPPRLRPESIGATIVVGMDIMEIDGDHLTPRTLPTPDAGPGQVLIEVAGAGINRADLLQMKGLHPPPPGAPAWPGLEVAGEIVAAGDDVDASLVGSRVMAL